MSRGRAPRLVSRLSGRRPNASTRGRRSTRTAVAGLGTRRRRGRQPVRGSSLCRCWSAFGGQPLALALAGLLLQVLGAVSTVWLITLPQAPLVLAITLSRSLRPHPPCN